MRKFLTQNLLSASKRIVFVILLAVLFLPNIVPTEVLAQTTAPKINTTLKGTGINDESTTGICPVDTVPAQTVGQFSKPVVEERGGILMKMGLNDTVDAYLSFKPVLGSFGADSQPKLDTILANCKTQARAGQIVFFVSLQGLPISGNNVTRGQGTAVFNEQTQTLEGNVKGLKLPPGMKAGDIPENPPTTASSIFSVNYIIQFRPSNGSGTFQRTMYQHETGFSGSVLNANQETLNITQVAGSTTTDDTPKDNYSIDKIKLGLHSTEAKKGFETLYRYAKDDPDADRKANVTIPFYVEWLGEGEPPKQNQTVIRQQDTVVTATFKGFYFGVSKFYKNQADIPKCGTGWTDFWCTSLLMKQEPSTPQPLPVGGLLKLPYTNVQQGENGDIPANYTTKPSAVKLFMGLPLAAFQSSNDNAIRSTNPPPITIEIYEKFEDLKKACEEGAQRDGKTVDCTKPENLYYGQQYKTIVADQSDDKGLVDQLFDFLRKVIAYIVLLITSFIYYIFSAILVPVIIALIKIHPYQDKFVNFIYPGWVIIRNISNIFFIVALLWVGLRTLLQLDDAAKSRSFIIRLILMALLVNFSLVIGQSIVGIADTVQSQFLPEGTKVVETLGHKLMVDPIITFRGGSDSLTDTSGRFDTDALASDLPKAIILLILAIAAFFAFVALIAFMVVRLAALWILYMLSPLAYVGRILPQTEKIADKWWTEFTKYAFAVPIMAFFLNITALMAVQMAKPTGTSVDTGGGSGTVIFGGLLNTGDLGAGAVSFAVTVISHFIVLVFLFIGMKFALSFGGVGAEKIVDAAKKGFNAVTTRPAKWAGGLAKDAAKEYGRNQYERRIAGGMLDPKAWKDQFKGRVAATTEKKKLERLSAKANRLSPGNILPTEGSLADRSKHIGKYMWAKIKRQDPHGLLRDVKDMKDRASILTDPARQDLETKQADAEAKILAVGHEQELLDNNTITQARALSYRDALDQRITSARQQSIDLNKKRQKLEDSGRTGGTEHQAVVNEIAALNTDMGNLLNARAIVANPTGDMTLTDPQIASMSVIFDPKQLATELSGDLKKAEQQSQHTAKQLARDDELRSKYHVATITEPEQRALLRQAALLEQKAISTYMPASMTALAAGRSLESEQAKKIEHIEDVDELVQAYSGAMSKNNTALATAIAKKLAKVGGMDELLKSQGYNNNMKDFQRFMEENFKHLAPQIRVQVGSEISQVAKSNGNLTLGNSANYNYNKSTGETTVKWAQPEETARKVDAKLKGTQTAAFAKMQKTDISEERGGMSYLHQGAIDNLNSMNSNTLNSFLRQSSPSLRKHILDAANSNKVKSQVLTRLREGAR